MGFPYDDLRSWIADLEKEGQLCRVTAEVDWRFELGAVVRKTWDEYGLSSPALLFENIKDYKPPKPHRVFVGSLQSYDRIALALGLPIGTHPRDIAETYRERIKKPIKPEIVETGPVKENIVSGEEVDLTMFPIPYWHERDGNRYIGTLTCTITKDPDTGWINVGNYRQMLLDKRSQTVLMEPGRSHIGLHYLKYIERNEPMPVAVAIGQDPCNVLVTIGELPVGACEWDYAGGLRGKPVRLTKAETSDLLVPADAEIVIEGTIDPKERAMEGPFGEFTGYYSSLPSPKPVIRVKCITFRNDPIFQGTLEGYPPNEDHVMISVVYSALTKEYLINAGVPGVVDVCHPVSACAWGTTIVSIKPVSVAHAMRVATALWGHYLAWALHKIVIVVDEDIDPWDWEMVNWAMNWRVEPSRDVYVIPKTYGDPLDPSIAPEDKPYQGRLLIDATRPFDWKPREAWGSEGVGKGVPLKYPPVNRPALEVMEYVNGRWPEYKIERAKKYTGRDTGYFKMWWTPEFIRALREGKITP